MAQATSQETLAGSQEKMAIRLDCEGSPTKA